jgi:hypothetical protein
MGLDGVELVMGWEEAFGISIPDSDAAVMFTTRDATSWIFDRVKTSDPEDTGCLSLRAFNRLRRGFLAHGVPRSSIRPQSKISTLLPGRNRRDLLSEIRERAGFPPLRPLPFGLQFTFARIRDMVLDTVIGQHSEIRLPGHGWSRQQVREVVRSVMYAQLALQRFSDEDQFVNDLKID